MKLSQWAKKKGLSYKTAWRMFKDGKLPVKAEQLATGTILVEDEIEEIRFCPTCGQQIKKEGCKHE